MPQPDAVELEALLARIKSRAGTGAFRVTQHAQQEMVEEEITLDEVVQTIRHGEIAEVAQGPLPGPAAFPPARGLLLG
jgi:hypothetical protein